MKEIYRNVLNSEYCDYFLIKDFSERDSEDKEVRAKVMAIAKQKNYPSEYWNRVNSSNLDNLTSTSDSNWFWWIILIGIIWFLLK